jgi:hypothetical protein
MRNGLFETAARRFPVRQPLLRLLAINLAAGILVAALLLGGLLLVNPFELRHLIFADDSPGTAFGLLLFGFVITFGSAAMGTAIMAMGSREVDISRPRGPGLRHLVPQLIAVRRHRHGSQR